MPLNILVCIKRVPATGSKISLMPDGQAIDTRYLGFTISPHEECALEEAVRLAEANPGSTTTVLSLGPEAATEQLRDAMAIGIDNALLLETDGREWDPAATASAIVAAIRSQPTPFDLILMGNESADSGGYQVGVRVARGLGWPCVSGVKTLALSGGVARVSRESLAGRESLEVSLPVVLTIREGLNLPRYPSLPCRLKAKKKPLARLQPAWHAPGLELVRLLLPPEEAHQVMVLGHGAAAAPAAVEVFKRLGVL